MNYHVLTLFPDMIEQASGASILGRAIKNGCIGLDIINIRDFSANKHMRVDDYPYGGGAGMVMEAEPVYRAVEAAKQKCKGTPRVVYLTPQAEVLCQTKVEELADEEDLILICGHYEGIDDRVLTEVVTDYVSIGDYVLTGGELGALVLIDAVSRFVPGVLSNEESSQFESHQDNLLEYPHFTRPEVWHDKAVPKVLLSGDHKKINKWRYEESLKRTLERRSDMLKKSYAVNVLYIGDENTLKCADEMAAALSRYSELLDYNRAKLRKNNRVFDANQLAVFVIGKSEIPFGECFVRIEGSDTPVVLVLCEESIDGDKCEDMLSEKGFRVVGSYVRNGNDSKFEQRISLDIRKKLERS